MMLDETARHEDAGTGRGPDPSGTLTALVMTWLDTGLNRVGLRGPFARDLVLAVMVGLISLGFLWGIAALAAGGNTPFAPATLAALAVLTVAQSLVVGARRWSPLLCLGAVVATQIAMFAVLPSDVSYQSLAPLIVAYTCGTVFPASRLFWVLAVATVVQSLGGYVAVWSPLTSLSSIPGVEDLLFVGTTRAVSTVIGFGVLAFFGHYMATRRSIIELTQLRAAEAIEAHKERTNGAIRAERTRMARELHDIAAHHLSGMVVQAGAAGQLIGRNDQAAREATDWIRSQGKETLGSLRMVVGALRDPGEQLSETDTPNENAPDGAPVPGIAMLDRLVEGERVLGAVVELARTGASYALPPVADVTFYRVTQEALANARDHAAGARVHVALHHEASEVVLQVENEPGVEREETLKQSRGMGLVGMGERAQLIGAVLQAGPTESGGWRVRLTLPFTREISANGADHAAVKEFHDQGGPG